MAAQGNNQVDGRLERGPDFPSAPAQPMIGASVPLGPTDVARDAADAATSRWGVLRHKYYRRVLFAQWFSNLGTWSEFFAIQMFLAKATGRLDDQGVLGVCQQAPIFLLGLLGGVASDRVNRRTLLVVTQVLAGLVAAGVALVTIVDFENVRHAVYWLYALGIAYGVVMAFNFPAWQVVTPRLVPKDELTKAITLNGIQFNLARAVGPALTGLVLAHYAPAWVLGFNALTFLAMAAVVMTTPDAPAPPASGNSWSEEIGEARRYLWRNPGPRAVLFAMVAFSALAAPLVRLLSNFVIDVYGVPAAAPGAAPGVSSAADAVGGKMLGAMGLGAVIAGIMLKAIPRWYPKHHFIPLSAIGLGLSISVYALTTKIWAGYIAMTVCGWFWIWAFNQTWAALSVLAPDRLRGRIMSVMNVMSFGATAVGVWVAGTLGEYAKTVTIAGHTISAQHATQGAILLLSVPLVLAGLVMLMFRVPEIDEMPRRGTMGLRDRLDVVEAVTARTHRPAGNGTAVDRAEAV